MTIMCCKKDFYFLFSVILCCKIAGIRQKKFYLINYQSIFSRFLKIFLHENAEVSKN